MDQQNNQNRYWFNLQDEGGLRQALNKLLKEFRVPQAITIPTGATSFEVRGDVMLVTGAAAVNIATISGGYEGQELTLVFTDGNITIVDNATGATNTINIGAAFTSTANDVIKLIYSNRSWREVSRSVN